MHVSMTWLCTCDLRLKISRRTTFFLEKTSGKHDENTSSILNLISTRRWSILMNFVLFYYKKNRSSDSHRVKKPFWDEHGLRAGRTFYHFFCSLPRRFADCYRTRGHRQINEYSIQTTRSIPIRLSRPKFLWSSLIRPKY